MSKIYVKNIVPECLELTEKIHTLISDVFKDKTVEESVVGMMLISMVFEKTVENRLGKNDTKALKDYISNYMNLDNEYIF